MANRRIRFLLCLFVAAGLYAATAAADSIVQVRVPDQKALQALVEHDFIIDNVRGLVATIYANDADLKRLDALGYAAVLIGQDGLAAHKADPAYYDYAQVTAALEAYAAGYPHLCRLESLGKSVLNRDLWALRITDNPGIEEDEPEFKYVATMHGDEPVGTAICLPFIDRLLTDYGVDAEVTELVDETDIWIVPLMNPDGREAAARPNANGADLNRSFPSYPGDFTGTFFDGEDPGDAGREPEVSAVMAWTMANSFVLSANFHTGALVVNYPYDNVPGISSGSEAPAPDDALLEDISLRYAEQNPPMYASPYFTNGVVNGSAWYSITGGMQDWNYRYAGCIEVTIELSDDKWPSASQLPQLWANNENAMLAYLAAVHIGVRGIVTDRVDGAPVWAQVEVGGNTQRVYTDADVGDYHRLLLPGSYGLTCWAPGYIAYHVDEVDVTEGDTTRVDVALSSGDVNQDGSIDASDIQAAVNAVLGYTVPYDADVDGRGLSATDIQAVINKVIVR